MNKEWYCNKCGKKTENPIGIQATKTLLAWNQPENTECFILVAQLCQKCMVKFEKTIKPWINPDRTPKKKQMSDEERRKKWQRQRKESE